MNNKQRLKIHREVFQKIHLATTAHDNARIVKMIDLIRAWSFALNGSNGEASEYEIKKRQDSILKILEEI